MKKDITELKPGDVVKFYDHLYVILSLPELSQAYGLKVKSEVILGSGLGNYFTFTGNYGEKFDVVGGEGVLPPSQCGEV